MTDKPDYTRRNPKLIIGDAALERNNGPVLAFYNADGSPNQFKCPSDDDLMDFINVLIQKFEGQDIRKLLWLIDAANNILEEVTLQFIASEVAYTLDANEAEGFDHNLLCEGIAAYFDPEETEEETASSNEDDIDRMLDKFFVAPGTKPN